MLILNTFCVKCGYENIDWKKHDDKDELISCYKCHSLYETDFSLISVHSTENIKHNTLK